MITKDAIARSDRSTLISNFRQINIHFIYIHMRMLSSIVPNRANCNKVMLCKSGGKIMYKLDGTRDSFVRRFAFLKASLFHLC